MRQKKPSGQTALEAFFVRVRNASGILGVRMHVCFADIFHSALLMSEGWGS